MELALPSILLFSLSFSPPPDLIPSLRTQPAGSILSSYLGQQQRQEWQQQGGKAEQLLGSHGAFGALLVRDGGPTVTWRIPGREPQRASGRRPPQVARRISLDFVYSLQLPATLLVCKILYILLLKVQFMSQLHQPHLGTC